MWDALEEREAISARDKRDAPVQSLKEVEQLQSPPQRECGAGKNVAGEDRKDGAVHLQRAGAVQEKFAE